MCARDKVGAAPRARESALHLAACMRTHTCKPVKLQFITLDYVDMSAHVDTNNSQSLSSGGKSNQMTPRALADANTARMLVALIALCLRDCWPSGVLNLQYVYERAATNQYFWLNRTWCELSALRDRNIYRGAIQILIYNDAKCSIKEHNFSRPNFLLQWQKNLKPRLSQSKMFPTQNSANVIFFSTNFQTFQSNNNNRKYQLLWIFQFFFLGWFSFSILLLFFKLMISLIIIFKHVHVIFIPSSY